MNIDIASIDMVSEVNMVSSGRARPAPGLPPGSRPPVPRPSFLTKSLLSRRGCAALRALPSSLENFISLETRFPPSPLFPSHCRRPLRRLAPTRLLLLLQPRAARARRSSPGLRRHLRRPRSPRGAGRAGGGRRACGGRGWRAAAVGICLLLARFGAKKPEQPSLSVGKL